MEPNQTPGVQSVAKRIALEVRAEMARQGVTQESLGVRTGWGQKRVSRRLTGKVPLDVVELAAIAEVLGVPAAQFLPTSAVTS